MATRYYKPWTPYLYLVPAAIVLVTFVFFPLVRAVYFSLTEYNLLSDPRWVGLSNYQTLFASQPFYRAFWNSVRYFLVVVPVLIVVPMLVAVLVNDRKLPGVTAFRTAYYFPVVTSMVIAGIMWRWLYTERGLLNYAFTSLLPLLDEPVGWLTDPGIALYAVMAVTIWKGIGYYMVIYLAGLQSIPGELYEAATLDGAGPVRKLISITVPLLAPSMAVVGVLSAMAAMKVFDEVFVMTGGGPFQSTRTVVFEIYDLAFDKLRFGYASAMGVVLFAILFVFSVVSVRFGERRYEGAQ